LKGVVSGTMASITDVRQRASLQKEVNAALALLEVPEWEEPDEAPPAVLPTAAENAQNGVVQG
jgi:hypothetical protein